MKNEILKGLSFTVIETFAHSYALSFNILKNLLTVLSQKFTF